MDFREILSKVDHTILDVNASWNDVKQFCDDAIEYNTASICIPPSYVKEVKEYLIDRKKICSVVGFPNGYNTTYIKVQETIDAISNGADEIDMVINIGIVKNKKYDALTREIMAIREVCKDKILKVIIETCLLTDEEKIKMCEIVTRIGADFIKTSTGFSHNGATEEDVILMKQYIGPNVKIKASGGIRTLQDAEKYIKLGAERIGASKIIKSIKELKQK